LYTGRGKHAKKIFFVKSNPQNKFCEISPQGRRKHEVKMKMVAAYYDNFVQRPPSFRRELARTRSPGLAAVGFVKFLSPFPKQPGAPHSKGESFAFLLKIRAIGFAARSSAKPKSAGSHFHSMKLPGASAGRS
jgi:hypothetical protein